MFWDITLYNLPWRYHLSECINHGELPLWNPWMNNGFPQMAHAETWYPVSWFFSLVFGYNISTLQYEYLFNLLIAGIGFYKFSGLFQGISENIRLTASVSYMLCGVFISQASQLGYITSGAWMVFVFYYLILFLRKPEFRNGMLLVLFYFLLVTGGYPGNYIVVTYICLAFTPIYLFYLHRKKVSLNWKKFFLNTFFSVIVFFCLYLVALVPSLELQNHMTRGELDYTNIGFGAMTGSTSLSGYLTLISPSASIVKSEFWGEYPMLNDVYFGILNFIIITYFLVRGKDQRYYKLSIFLFLSSLIFLMISVATIFPMHYWIYKLVPFIDRFRFPSLFRIFFVFQFIVISLFAWQFLVENKHRIKEFLIMCLIFLTMGVPFIFNQFISIPIANIFSDFDQTILAMNTATLVTIDMIILGVIIALFFSLRNKLLISTIVLILFTLDISLHVWIRSPRFVSSDKNPVEIQNALNAIQDTYPLPNQNISQGEAHNQFQPIDGLWLNTFAYYKYPVQTGSSPYSTEMYRLALNDGTFEKFSHQPLVFVLDRIDAFGEENVDSLLTDQIKFTDAGPNAFQLIVTEAKNKFLVFNHNFYPGWEFIQNGKESEKFMIHPNYMATKIISDSSEIKIQFNPKYIRELFYLSVTTLILLLLFLLISRFRQIPNKMN